MRWPRHPPHAAELYMQRNAITQTQARRSARALRPGQSVTGADLVDPSASVESGAGQAVQLLTAALTVVDL